MGIEIRSPKTDKEWVEYYDLRYRVLRQPWNQPIGSERNEGDASEQHFALYSDLNLIAVGRLDQCEEKKDRFDSWRWKRMHKDQDTEKSL